MRRLGLQPLTGAEKQRRHRERVKARLAEAERLKALLANGPGHLPGLATFYDNVLGQLGATAEERDALKAELPRIRNELRAVLEARAQNDLEWIREKERKRDAGVHSRPGRHGTSESGH